MKTYIICILLAFTTTASFAQRLCCKAQGFSTGRTPLFTLEFAKDNNFINAHMNPLPFNGEITKGEYTTFKCIDGKDGNAFVITSKIHPNNVVFMFHEWWGLNDYIKQEAIRLSDKLFRL